MKLENFLFVASSALTLLLSLVYFFWAVDTQPLSRCIYISNLFHLSAIFTGIISVVFIYYKFKKDGNKKSNVPFLFITLAIGLLVYLIVDCDPIHERWQQSVISNHYSAGQ